MEETTEKVLPDIVAELIEPIPGDSPTGADAATVEEYFKLDMEIGKTAPNYKLCIELAETILREKSKDMWVASWLCFAWFRAEKISGLKNGLCLLVNLQQTFGEKIFPAKINYRSKAIQYLNSNRFYKLLEKEDVNKSNADDLKEAYEFYKALADECEKQFPQNPVNLKAFEQTLNDLLEKANEFAKPVKAAELHKEEAAPAEEMKTETSQETPAEKPKEAKEETKAVPPPIKTAPPPAESGTGIITSEKEAVATIRKSLTFFFKDEDSDNLKLPKDPFIYGMTRSLVWGKVNLPPNKENITQIDPPNATIQTKIREWYESSDWDVLIPRIETNFLRPDSGFLFWLDVQRFEVEALEKKGGIFIQAAEEIKFALGRLVKRFPQLTELKFKNKETAFADEETIEWIDSAVGSLFSSGKSAGPSLLPPIMGEDYIPINQDYEKACKELPKNFEQNVAQMQKQISGDTRRKGRFLRQLNLANLCVEAKQFQLARVHLLQLIDKIEQYNLAEWEPALCVAVWQSTYLVNGKIISKISDDQKTSIEKEQNELFAKIANYDGVLAIKLSNKNQQGGK